MLEYNSIDSFQLTITICLAVHLFSGIVIKIEDYQGRGTCSSFVFGICAASHVEGTKPCGSMDKVVFSLIDESS